MMITISMIVMIDGSHPFCITPRPPFSLPLLSGIGVEFRRIVLFVVGCPRERPWLCLPGALLGDGRLRADTTLQLGCHVGAVGRDATLGGRLEATAGHVEDASLGERPHASIVLLHTNSVKGRLTSRSDRP